MLSRIANSLLWTGRYLERARHTARYVNVHYFSTLDSPILSKKEFFLESISSMTGLSYEYSDRGKFIDEQEFIFRIALDESNPVSIKSTISMARENTRGARDILSSELWESVNKFYHSVNSFSRKDMTEKEILEFTKIVVDNCAIVSGYIDHSLVHDETWSLIQLGKHLEAAGQITRILIAKAKDIIKVGDQKLGKAVENFECITLLKSVESFDMSRIHYKSVPNYKDSYEFLILNKKFPRSLVFNINQIRSCLEQIKIIKSEDKKSPEFFAGRMFSSLNYMTIEEIEKDILPFLEKTLDDIYKLGMLIEERISY